MNIAIISPSQKAYSETFIWAHKKLLKGTIHYLYGGSVPKRSDFTKKELAPTSLLKETFLYIQFKLLPRGLNWHQYLLKKYLKKNNIHCVLAEYGTTGIPVYQVCEQLNIPLIVHFHGFDASVYDVLESHKQEYQKMFRSAKYIIGVSKVMCNKLKNLGVNENKLIYNTYGPNPSFFEIHRKNNSQILFFGAGRFMDKKAPYYTIIAFSEVLKKHPSAQMIIGGNGPLLESSINLARYLGVENNISFPGVLTPHEIREYLSKAFAFVQHSITARNGDMEGTPVGILEASAAGVPVISTFHAGIPDVIIDKKTGLLCEEHDYRHFTG